MRNRARVIDVTHQLSGDVPKWDADKQFSLETTLDYDQCSSQTKFRLHTLTMACGVGTHLDAPAHCIPGGKTVDQIAVENFIRPLFVIDVSKKATERFVLSVDDIRQAEQEYHAIQSKDFVIIRTDWFTRWSSPAAYYNNGLWPIMSPEAAEYLIERAVVGVGFDTFGPDLPGDRYPVHEVVLSAGCYIVENMTNLDQLPTSGATCIILPLQIIGATESPVRVIVISS